MVLSRESDSILQQYEADCTMVLQRMDVGNRIAQLARCAHEFLVPLFHQLFGKMPVELSITLVHCLIALSIHEDIRVKLLESKLLEALLACLQNAVRKAKAGTCLNVPSFNTINERVWSSRLRMVDIKEGNEADVELRIAAIHCLCGYICESQARDWFLSLGGVNKIVQCLMNTSVPLRQAAATFLQLAAREPPIAAAFIHAGMLHWGLSVCLDGRRLGAITMKEPLDPPRHRMLDQKTMRRAIPVWETAIEALFSNYLPAKLAYMGRLDMTDVTEEGFYVTRHVERIFPILEELLVSRLCPLRTIYVCNFKSTTPALNPSVGVGAKPVRRRARSYSFSGGKRPGTNLKMSEVNSTNVNTTQEEFDALMTASAF
uniref:Uncharacterized protein n=1 Tax=Timema bartmani TaxID=61472 RepID=A0A7R9I496_9NEOP|nr:unnamed protein product [Timema bartmani]